MAICTLFVLLPASCAKKSEPARTAAAFNTVCSINAYDDGTAALYDSCFARLDELEQLLSAHIPSSDISRISDAAGIHPVSISRTTMTVLKTALEYAEKSGGAFDPTVGPLIDLWGIGTESARVPSEQEIGAALALVDWTRLILDEAAGTAYLLDQGMKLDVGGIAKGYAADELVSLLKRSGVRRAIVDLGGNICVIGTRPSSGTEADDGSLWRVGVKNPFHPESGAALRVDVRDTSVVTSGPYERYFMQDGRRYHHILDSRTGFPVENGLVSVTIIDGSSMLSDVLSTTVYALGLEKGMELLEKEGRKGICISEDGWVTCTPDMQKVIKTLSDELRL